jgi:hypothetical protein
MREPPAEGTIFGAIAEFDRADRLLAAAKQVRDAQYRSIDAYSPFPIAELTELLHLEDTRVPVLTVFGGIAGAALGYGMQAYTNLAYPIDVGNRPLVATPGFMLITFELLVLIAVLATIGGMFLFNRLPRLHHPVFEVGSFKRASWDRFFLIIFSNDGRFDPEATCAFLRDLSPLSVALVPGTKADE